MQKFKNNNEVTMGALIRGAQKKLGNMHFTLALDAAELQHMITLCLLACLKGLHNAKPILLLIWHSRKCMLEEGFKVVLVMLSCFPAKARTV